MRKIHQPNIKAYELHFRNQAGGAALPGFRGVNIQRGYGLGSMFRSLFRFDMPLVKSGAKSVGKAALNTGIEVAKDVLAGKSLRNAAVERAKEAGGRLKQQAINTLVPQTGTGRKRKASEASASIKRGKPSQGINKARKGAPASRPSARKVNTSQGKQSKRKRQPKSTSGLGSIFE